MKFQLKFISIPQFCVIQYKKTEKCVIWRYTNADLKIFSYLCVHIKIMPWKFRILNPRFIKLFAHKVFVFLKKKNCNVFYCFYIFVKKRFTYLRCAYLKGWKLLWCTICVILVFCMKTNVLQKFHICISEPLT